MTLERVVILNPSTVALSSCGIVILTTRRISCWSEYTSREVSGQAPGKISAEPSQKRSFMTVDTV
jgi:hypothetical protein